MRQMLLSPRWWWLHALTVVAVLVMLRLGLWQWHRAQSGSGGIQNYAYAFQWPLFAGFAVVLWWKTLRIESQHRSETDDDAAEADGAARPKPPMSRPARATGPLPVAPIGHLPGVRIGISTAPQVIDETDDEVRMYNAFLARLNARSSSGGARQGG